LIAVDQPARWTTPTQRQARFTSVELDAGIRAETGRVPDLVSNGANALLPMPELFQRIETGKEVTGGPPPFLRL
jgi:hypothetical protein